MQAGVENLNPFQCEYELHTICSLFPALTPEQVLSGNDAFYTRHLLANLKKSEFERKYIKIKSKKKK